MHIPYRPLRSPELVALCRALDLHVPKISWSCGVHFEKHANSWGDDSPPTYTLRTAALHLAVLLLQVGLGEMFPGSLAIQNMGTSQTPATIPWKSGLLACPYPGAK